MQSVEVIWIMAIALYFVKWLQNRFPEQYAEWYDFRYGCPECRARKEKTNDQ